MKQNKKILIVGGTGFIGYHLSKICLKNKFKVYSYSTQKPQKKRKLKKVTYLICDITKPNKIKKKFISNLDYIINLGGYVDHSKKKKTYYSHYEGCKNLANAYLNQNIKLFIQMGSGLEYGKLQNASKENSNCFPKSVYAKAKYKATKFLLNLYKKKNFPVIILRLYQAYGPYQEFNRLIPFIIFNSLKNKKFLCSEGEQIRDFIFIDDLVKIIFKILNKTKLKGNIFNIGSGQKIKIKNLIKKIVKFCNGGQPIFGGIKMRKDEGFFMCPSIVKIKKLLKFKNFLTIDEGLVKTIKYYKFLSNIK